MKSYICITIKQMLYLIFIHTNLYSISINFTFFLYTNITWILLLLLSSSSSSSSSSLSYRKKERIW